MLQRIFQEILEINLQAAHQDVLKCIWTGFAGKSLPTNKDLNRTQLVGIEVRRNIIPAGSPYEYSYTKAIEMHVPLNCSKIVSHQ